MRSTRHDSVTMHRLRSNPEERRFLNAWKEMNRVATTLRAILAPAGAMRFGVPDFMHCERPKREREVAATVIQWLGSPVGREFLRQLGYEKRKPK